MATHTIAEWVSELKSEEIPPSVSDAAVKSFANYVGCTIGGFSHEATKTLLRSYAALPQALGKCSVLGGDQKVDPLQAALVNAFAAHLHDYDDTHLATIIHPTAAVASALLAYSGYASSKGHEMSGQCFISALITGMEIECLLGLSVYPSHYDLGWHITASVGSIGAAIAVSKAMNLPVEGLVNAIGLASASVSGMRRHFGSHTKPFGVAFAAQAGLQAALLAQGGMTAATDSLEGNRGWIECVCPESDSAKGKLEGYLKALVDGVGVDGDKKWEVEKNSFKPFPCGIVIHPVIDGCSQLRADGLKTEDIKSMEMFVHPLVLELTGKKLPKDGLEAKFSVYHGAACGILYGKATPAQYTDEVVKKTEQLRAKITATVDEGIKADECRIVVQTADNEIQKHVEHAVGSLAHPLSETQLQKKFEDQSAPVIGEAGASSLFSSLMQIMDSPDASQVVLSHVGR